MSAARPPRPFASKRVSRRLGGALALALVSVNTACEGAAVATRAVWIDGEDSPLRIYDHGRLRELPFGFGPAAGEDRARFEIGPDGRWLVTRDPESLSRGWLYDLATSRRWPIPLPARRVGFNAGIRFAHSGTAIYWTDRICSQGDCNLSGLWVLPFGGELESPSLGETWPLERFSPLSAEVVMGSAPDAPVLYGVAPTEVLAWRIPTRPGQRLELLDRRDLGFDATTVRRVPGCGLEEPIVTDTSDLIALVRCARPSMLIAPGGDAVAVPAPAEVCDSEWVRWAPGGPLECISHPNFPSAEGMLAMLGPDLYAARDEDSLYAYDRVRERTDRLPILGSRYLNFSAAARDGRSLLFGSYAGPLMRVSEAGVELLSAVQSACARPRAPRVSPAGNWVTWSCGLGTGESIAAGFSPSLVRVHDGKLERFAGIDAWPVSIDDEGNVLFVTSATEESFDDGFGEFDGGIVPPDGTSTEETAEGFDVGPTTGLDAGEETGGESGETSGGDDGSILVETYDVFWEQESRAPLTLYSLSTAGSIDRISGLEPSPLLVRRLSGVRSAWVMGPAQPVVPVE